LAGDLGLEVPPEPTPPAPAPVAKAPSVSPPPAAAPPIISTSVAAESRFTETTVTEPRAKLEEPKSFVSAPSEEREPVPPAKPYRPSFSEPAYRPDPSVREAAERRIGAISQEKRREERRPAQPSDRGRERYPNRDTRRPETDDIAKSDREDDEQPSEIDETSHVLGVEAMLDEIVDVECVEEGAVGDEASPGGAEGEGVAPRRRRRRRGGRNRRRSGDSRPPRPRSTESNESSNVEFDEGDTDLGYVRGDAEIAPPAAHWEQSGEALEESGFGPGAYPGGEADRDRPEGSSEGNEAAPDDEGEGERRPRRRRRRSRGGKGRSGARAPQGESVDSEHPQEADSGSDEPNHFASDQAVVASNGPSDLHDDDDEGEDLGGGFGKQSHKGFPTWEETVGMIIATNMDARAKSPKTSGPRGRGRGRGNSRGGNNYRGGGNSRPSGPSGGEN
jgi:ribonuclease E